MQQKYTCPGERYPISRSVHLSRLAAFYPKCRDCAQRHDAGPLPQQTLERLQSTERRVAKKSLLTPRGVRGVYLNEFTRYKAAEYACALASILWTETPLIGRIGNNNSTYQRPRRQGPAIVVGHDERPSSPDIMIGVVAALRRMGCRVIDIGLTTQPCFRFAVDHLHAAAGMYVTGSGCGPSWTGCDFAGAGGQPFGQGGRLEAIESQSHEVCCRPTRSAGSYRSFEAFIPYEASLRKHLHGIRPLTVGCECSARVVRDMLSRSFEKLACELVLSSTQAPKPGVRKPHVAAKSCFGASDVDVAFLIDEDGSHCQVFDEHGRSVEPEKLLGLLTECVLAESGQAAVAIVSPLIESVAPIVEISGGNCLDGGSSEEALWQSMRQHNAHLGMDATQCIWFRETVPTSDAILVVASILQTLSHSNRNLSQLAHREVVAQR